MKDQSRFHSCLCRTVRLVRFEGGCWRGSRHSRLGWCCHHSPKFEPKHAQKSKTGLRHSIPGEWKATYGGIVCCVSAREIKALVVVWPSHIVSITLEVSFKKSCNVLKMMRLTEYENCWLGSLELHVQICIFVPSALLPPVTSKHLLPKTVTAPPVKVHFWASEPMQVWIVTAAPSVFDAAVRHLAVYTCTQYNCGDCF